MAFFQKKGKVAKPEEYERGRLYDYSTPEGRVATAGWLFEQAKNERTALEEQWIEHNNYYNFKHKAAMETAEEMERQGLNWDPAVVPDPWIMVESQIVPEVPVPEFRGRDDWQDSQTAKERELAVKYICEANRLTDMNTSNERRLRKLGDAFWKAYWDENMPFGAGFGNIRIRDVDPVDIYPDPTAGNGGLQEGEYVAYVYDMHKLKFWRIFGETCRKQGLSLEDLAGVQYRTDSDMLAPFTQGTQFRDDMVQVMEFWFHHPCDHKDAKAGDVGCTIQVTGHEIKFINNYWKRVGRQCQLFPFVHYWCIRDETQFWNKSELEPIIPTVDAADRELTMGLLNDAMMANDIIVREEGSLADGSEITNVPGSEVVAKAGRGSTIRRLGGLHTGGAFANMVDWLQQQIQRTNRNFDTNNGMESARITTASGLLQLRTDAETQQKLKRADRDAGFCRLYELLDFLALEFFDDERLLTVGAKQEGKEPESVLFKADNYAVVKPGVVDPETGEEISPAVQYFPRVDVTVTAGNGISKNPAATLEVLDKLAAVQVTEENWKLLAAELELLDIPQKQEIIEQWKARFEPAVPPHVTEALASDPELLEVVTQAVEMKMADEAAMGAQQGMPGAAMTAETPAAMPVQMPMEMPVM